MKFTVIPSISAILILLTQNLHASASEYSLFKRSLFTLARALDFDCKALIYHVDDTMQFRVVPGSKGRLTFALSGKNINSVLDPRQEWMYIMLEDGEFLVWQRYITHKAPLKRQGLVKLFHSSLAGRFGKNHFREPVAAGTLKTDRNSFLTYMDENSGHYRFKNHIWVALYELEKAGFCLDSADIHPSEFEPVSLTERIHFHSFAASKRISFIRSVSPDSGFTGPIKLNYDDMKLEYLSKHAEQLTLYNAELCRYKAYWDQKIFDEPEEEAATAKKTWCSCF